MCDILPFGAVVTAYCVKCGREITTDCLDGLCSKCICNCHNTVPREALSCWGVTKGICNYCHKIRKPEYLPEREKCANELEILLKKYDLG